MEGAYDRVRMTNEPEESHRQFDMDVRGLWDWTFNLCRRPTSVMLSLSDSDTFLPNEHWVWRCADGSPGWHSGRACCESRRVTGYPHIFVFFYYRCHFLAVSTESFPIADVGTGLTLLLFVNCTLCPEVNSSQGENEHQYSATPFVSRFLPLACLSALLLSRVLWVCSV
jgi:hypothetical protein